MRTRAGQYRCPACGFRVFNRRYTRCESCGRALPKTLLLAPEQRAALDLQHEMSKLERLQREAADRRLGTVDNPYLDGGG